MLPYYVMGERKQSNLYVLKCIRKLYLCVIVVSSWLSWLSSASLPHLKSLIQVYNGLIKFFCKSEAALACGLR